MSAKEYGKRFIYFFIGLFIIALGIALSTKSNLGVSTISSVPYVLSQIFTQLTLGQFTIIVQLIFLFIQFLILRKNFRLFDLLQIVSTVIFGYFVDFWVAVIRNIDPPNYAVQWVLCVISMFTITFGLNIEVRASVTMVASDGLLDTIAKVYYIEFSKVKIAFDCIQVAIAVSISLIFTHSIIGVREGTLAAAIFIGLIVKLYDRYLGSVYEKLGLVSLPRYREQKSPKEKNMGKIPKVNS